MRIRPRLVALVTLVMVLAAACGTRADKAAFYDALARTGGSGGGVTANGDGSALEAQGGGVVDPATGAVTKQGRSGGGASSGSGVEGSRSGDGAGAAATAQNRPDVSADVVGDVIQLGMHVPITGAAPIPTDFTDTIKVLEEYINTEAPIGGRKIKLQVEDDGYDAQVGLAACKKLADGDPLFVIGHTMPAAEDACADYFNDKKIPYMMRGTYPEILNDRPLAWLGTVADDIQGRLLADYVLHQLSGEGRKAAVVYQNDQVAAKTEFVARFEAGGGKIVGTEESVPRQSDFSATIQKLESAGAEFVLLSMPPVDAIKIAVQAQGAGYHPTWLGGGTWWNYNMVLESAGAALDGAIVLSPWASIDSAASDGFKQVFRRYRPNSEPQDIGLIIWGWLNLVRTAMEAAGPNLSRASFIAALDELQFSEPYWHPIAYSPTDHRGADSVVVFRADGQRQRWRQVTGFTSSL